MSLTSGVMSSNLKEAVIVPLLKKICLDPELFKNFRPVSNLTFLSQFIERVVALRLLDHMKINNLYEEFQSSYRKFHSTETALTSVHDDILRHIDEKQCGILLLLDLSAAFDTIDHNILLSRLQFHLGVCDVAVQWFRSYLSERKQSVLINGVNSKSMPLICGVSPLKGLYWAQFLSLYTCRPLVRSLADMKNNIICMPMTASFILHSALPMLLIVWLIWRISCVI